MRALLAVLLLATTSFASWGGEFDYASYRSSSLPDAVAQLGVDPRADYWLDASTPKYQAVAVFTGKTRPISPNTKALMSYWATALPESSGHMALFTVEAEMTQDDSTYWMPIQDILLEPLKSEVPAGASVQLYLLLIGATKVGPVFVINEFAAGG